MREILFRGKTEKGEWIYWDIFSRASNNIDNVKSLNNDNYVVFYDEEKTPTYVMKREVGGFDYLDMQLETVGQFTGLTDKNGKKIFEGDILINIPRQVKNAPTVLHVIKDIRKLNKYIKRYAEYLELIGNIHDNPELLEVEDGTNSR